MSANHVHEFDPDSGWCSKCTYRDDGLLTGPGGAILRPPRAERPQPTTPRQEQPA